MRARLGKPDRHLEGGQALVEFALVVGLMMVLAMGVFDLGRAFDAQVSVTQAARDGARRGMDPSILDDSDRQSKAGAAAAAAAPVGSSVSVSGCSSDSFTVTVSFTLNAATPLMGNFALTSTMVSRCSNTAP